MTVLKFVDVQNFWTSLVPKILIIQNFWYLCNSLEFNGDQVAKL